MNNKFLSLLGMARKAGRVSLGFEQSLSSLHSGAAKAVFCAKDLSEKTKRGLVLAAQNGDVPVATVRYTLEELSMAVGQRTGIVCVNDAGFAKALLQREEIQ